MVALSVAEAANTARATDKAAGRPYVAVFLGGTSGIGMYGVQGLARTHAAAGEASSRGLRVYIVGRRASDALLAECAKLCPFGQFVFVQAQDLGLLADVDRVCAAITTAERAASARDKAGAHAAKIDLLVASQGILPFGGRQDTPEGLEHLAVLGFYGRARAVDRLLPLLTETEGIKDGGSPGHVAFVMNPTLEGPVVESDLALLKPENFTLINRGRHGALLTTFFAEALARRHPGTLSLVHYYPGPVMTDLVNTSKLGLGWRVFFWLLTPVVWLVSLSATECGQRVIFLGTTGCYPAAPVPAPAQGSGGGSDNNKKAEAPPRGLSVSKGADGQVGSGAYRITYSGETMKNKAQVDGFRARGLVETVYEHTQAVFAAIEAGKKFTG